MLAGVIGQVAEAGRYLIAARWGGEIEKVLAASEELGQSLDVATIWSLTCKPGLNFLGGSLYRVRVNGDIETGCLHRPREDLGVDGCFAMPRMLAVGLHHCVSRRAVKALARHLSSDHTRQPVNAGQ